MEKFREPVHWSVLVRLRQYPSFAISICSHSAGRVGPDTRISDRCVIGAACEVSSRETLPQDTVVYGSECQRYTKKAQSQVSRRTTSPTQPPHVFGSVF